MPDVVIEMAAPPESSDIPSDVVVFHPIVNENDEAYATSCCGPAPTLARKIARIRFAIAALVIVITSMYHGPPSGQPMTSRNSYNVSILADNLLHVAVVFCVCRGAFGEKKRTLLAYCLLEALFILLVIFKFGVAYIDEKTGRMVYLALFLSAPFFVYTYFYKIFIHYYFFLRDRERKTAPPPPPKGVVDEDSVSSIGDADFTMPNGVKKRNP
ncbi:hypothetical protein PRIPAC_87769 [Pristionchus pacificus]|uniref:Uncharacterized protein n=1 Tax=Pristionchus pacificus TaxID=54126 RepID=A0A454XL97_PRIPA|nr:hypothetical protein PRIPAC_87769 [Pristionchus pacificus]|eukprot:PDM62103.1 hypothetical protein PRIPAC_51545 [Pristionchus pacificus]